MLPDPALLRDGVAIVVSPLIALMQDQVATLQELGVAAACLNSATSPDEARDIARQARAGTLDLLYVAPERLLTPRFQEFIASLKIALFAIDEAHCVSHWAMISGRNTSSWACWPSSSRRCRASR
ncbi:ATP-dependent DNA helicase recQ [Chromobacterium violaceum]|uniref:DNA 3'-5' helicase n=1 Tax=Chromobacterium violaceum TaxID=536 RepID=A0A3S4LGI5_CHRVL|nr:ATP-dependent DNA helicase recQ [Chromobacterium violaceum]